MNAWQAGGARWSVGPRGVLEFELGRRAFTALMDECERASGTALRVIVERTIDAFRRRRALDQADLAGIVRSD